MVEMWILMIFPVAMIAAMACDLTAFVIPNRLSLALALTFAPAAFAVGMEPVAIGMHLLAGAAVLAVAFLAYMARLIGGGDAKLLAATAIWLGFDLLPSYLLTAAIAGGVFTLALLQFRRLPLPEWAARRDWVLQLHHHRSGVPYGVALALAGLFAFRDSALFHLAT